VPDTVSEAIEQRVLTEIDQRFSHTLEFLREMVRQPSVLGQEKGVQELIFERLEGLGLNPEMWDLDLEQLRQHPAFGELDVGYEDRPNVTARWPASQAGGRSVIFNGHIDVVSPEPLANWSYDPWSATVDGDWLYGRGAGDMKAGVAAMLLAVEAVQAAGVRLKGDVILETVIEEECTGNGTLACGLRGLRADAAIVPEAHGLAASLATVGVIWFKVHTRGSASHVLAADSAVNAIELNASERHRLYRDLTHPINLNIGIIRAGDWPSTVPSACTIACRLSCQPGVTVDETQARVRETVAAAAESDPWLRENPPEVEFFGFRAEPSVVDPESDAMRTLAECHTAVVGEPLAFRPGTATTDQRFFLDYWEMPATSYGPVAENIHAGNERVLIPSIAETARVLALYLLRWCEVDEE
jgi:acetylornithine deacetylase